LVYSPKNTKETKAYCQAQMNTLWDEVKRLRNPHTYYVDLSEKLWNLKRDLINKNKKG
jgi:nicotinate phosphoribosyltransferase